ncbi:MAG: DEAD/DEAH box helicase, partial [Treponema sp.]|nr:DEAD/DEAH box helicase [Treponema sp.]
MDFIEFHVHEALLAGLSAAGYVTCTPVQEAVLTTAQSGADVYVQSQTGTGKTAAFLVLIIQKLLTDRSMEGKKALIMVPTRELAVQVEEEARTLTSATKLVAYSFYGGVGYEKQIQALSNGVDIIVGTPGRLIDLEKGGQLDLSAVRFLVIDEADRMFDMGFYPDLRQLLTVLPPAEERQTMLFSATLNTYVKNLAWEYTRNAQEITIASENITVDQIDQELLHVSSDDKMKLLLGVLDRDKPKSVIIFCNTKRMCEVVAKRLKINGVHSDFIIGDLPQARRLKVIDAFKKGTASCLVATDVAARGIDVEELAMVVNYDLPNEAENYVHRIGRTARAGKSGKAYTFCSEQDVYNLPAIERYIEMAIPANLADPSLMVEDKSAGRYIRTENWHEETDGRSERSADRHGRGEAHGFRRTARENGGRTRVGRDRTAGRGLTARRLERDASGRAPSRVRQSDAEKLEGMSFDERMKHYRKKYAGGTAVAGKTASAA